MTVLNRRKSVRITDRVLLSVDTVAPERLQAVSEDFRQGIPLYNQEEFADFQVFVGAQGALARMRERDSDLGEFFQHLDNKMNMLLKRILGGKSPLDSLASQKINLSANGLAFYDEKPAAVDDLLEIHLVLLPGHSHVYCFGRVVACDPESAEEGGKNVFRIAVEFVLIMEEDRERVIQHNFKQQSLALRNRRLTPES